MKVILMQDVAKIGLKHSVVDVPAGYGQNQLIPKGLAKPATPENLKLVEKIKAEKGAKSDQAEATFFETKKALDGKVIKIVGLKHDNGHLFAAIKPAEVIEGAKAIGVILSPEMLEIKNPIKTTGEHEVILKHKDHEAKIKLMIE